jgi:6-phosphogluconolactonase
MGNDAHTASLFPDAPQLSAGLNPTTTDACLLVDPPVALHQRISMTLPRLLNAEQIVVHITGEEKAEVLQSAWAANAPQRYPIGAILRQQSTPVSVFSDRLVRLGS